MAKKAKMRQAVSPARIYDMVAAPYRAHESAPPPTHLFHYTQHEGLIGLAKTGRIWASDLRFLNDREELQHGMQILQSAITSSLRAGRLGPRGEPFDWMDEVDNLQNFANFGGVFAACFSETPDDLSQWRAYCQRGGYCLGFESAMLQKAFAQDAVIVRVLYRASEKRALADALVTATIHAWRRIHELTAGNRASSLTSLREGVEDVYLAAASAMKHESFAAEQEWRVVAAGHMSDPKVVQYRSGASLVVPYISLPVFSRRGKRRIPVAIAGPNPSGDLAADAMWSCLSDAGIEVADAHISGLPYRSW